MIRLKTLQWADELEPFLAWMKKENIQDVIEIGTGHGGLLQRIGQQTTGRLISIDLPNSGDQTGLGVLECQRRNTYLISEFHDRFRGFLGDSHDVGTRARVETFLQGERVDLLFLDGDDSHAGKLQDYLFYKHLVKQKGWIATHDIASLRTGVPQFWREITEGRQDSFEFNRRHPWGGIGVLPHIFPVTPGW